MARLLPLLIVSVMIAAPAAQEPTLEYRVKAAYLLNFARFVEWPAETTPSTGPLTICIADVNPFGPALSNMIVGETAGGRPLATRVVRGDIASCHIVFIPRQVATGAYIRARDTDPILTVGETPAFIQQGGIVNFVREDGRVRFEINPDAATARGLRISARLLQLARVITRRGPL